MTPSTSRHDDPLAERIVEADDGATLWMREWPSERQGEPVDPVEPTMILCHGGPGLADDFDDLAPLLRPLGRVIVWHQRGSGRSTPDGPFTIERFVADLETIRRAARVDRFVLVGHSWGANLGLFYAQRHSSRLDELVYISGIGIEWWPDFAKQHKANLRRRLGSRLGGRFDRLRERVRSLEDRRELRLLYLRSELGDVADEATARRLLEAEERFEVNQTVNATLNAECARLDVSDQRKACADLACPVHVITGTADPRPLDALASMIEALPNVRATQLSGAGHSPWIERPDEFITAISSGQLCPPPP